MQRYSQRIHFPCRQYIDPGYFIRLRSRNALISPLLERSISRNTIISLSGIQEQPNKCLIGPFWKQEYPYQPVWTILDPKNPHKAILDLGTQSLIGSNKIQEHPHKSLIGSSRIQETLTRKFLYPGWSTNGLLRVFLGKNHKD